MEEQHVRQAIRALINRKEKRISQLEAEKAGIDKEKRPLKYRGLAEDIERLQHSIYTLIELEHNLRLCGCPDEAYQAKDNTI